MFRNTKTVDSNKFRNDLEVSLTPLLDDLMQSSVTPEALDNSFNQLVECRHNVIEKHAPLQKVSRRQKRILQKPWLTKGLLISIKNKQKMHRNFLLNGNEFEKKVL